MTCEGEWKERGSRWSIIAERNETVKGRGTHKLYSSVLRNSKKILTFPALTFSVSDGTRGLSPIWKLWCSPYTFRRPIYIHVQHNTICTYTITMG